MRQDTPPSRAGQHRLRKVIIFSVLALILVAVAIGLVAIKNADWNDDVYSPGRELGTPQPD
jgi:cytochrome b